MELVDIFACVDDQAYRTLVKDIVQVIDAVLRHFLASMEFTQVIELLFN